ncbi:DUF3667 domain-containing protein [Pseudofulvibacter geojedonensis]|uniref:DUF3667 domain-containing protein n=1 Tax=Pseudofulvibacter geojedonensis TaxID=1123758 RepID=A0ABW3I2I8_9FLAO
MGKRRRKRISCPNCKTHLKEEMNFCFNCGQENHIRRVTVKMLINDFTSTYFSFDNKLFRSLKFLLFKPSFLSLEYLNGKIEAYLRPIRLYVFISFFFFILLGVTSNGSVINNIVDTRNDKIEKVAEEQDKTLADKTTKYEQEDTLIEDIDADFEEKMKQIFSDKKEARNFFNYLQNKLPILLFAMIPVLGFILFISFYKKEYFYIDHLVFALHLQAFLFVMLSITTIIDWMFSEDVGGFAFLALLIYGFIAAKKFYKRSIISTLFRLLIVGVLHVFISIIALTTFFFVVMNSYSI